ELDAALEAAVLHDPGLGECAAACHGPERVAAYELVLARRGRVEISPRDHLLGKRVEPLEAVPARDDDLACCEQVLEDPLLRLPVPHAAAAAALEEARRQGAVLAERAEHGGLHFGVV